MVHYVYLNEVIMALHKIKTKSMLRLKVFLLVTFVLFIPAFFASAQTVIFSDNFNSSYLTLASHVPSTVGTSWTLLINNSIDLFVQSYNNYVTPSANTANAGSLYTAEGTYPDANYEISSNVAYATGSSYTRSMALRIQDVNNMYLLRYDSTAMVMYKRVAGTWTQIGSATVSLLGNTSSSPYSGESVKFSVTGSILVARVDGVTKIAVTDTSITGTGKAGIGLGYINVATDDTGTGVGIDNVVVQTTSVDTTVPVISLTTPTTGVATTSAMLLSATATDDTYVSGVKFYLDDTLQGVEDTSSPYSIVGTTATTTGAHTAFSVARDISNNYATSTTISFTIDNVVPVVIFSDDFETSGILTTLASRIPNFGESWTQIINNSLALSILSNVNSLTVAASTVNAGSLYVASTTYSTADYEISSDIQFAAGDSSYTRSLAVRVQDSNNLYLLRYNHNTMTMYKRLAGTWSSIGSGSYTQLLDTNTAYPYYIATATFGVFGTTLVGKINGVTKLKITDSSITGIGKAGVGLGYVNISTDDGGTGLRVDNIVVQTIVVDTTVPIVSLTTPTNGTATSSVMTLSSSATDNVSVEGVKFYIDNILQGSETQLPHTL